MSGENKDIRLVSSPDIAPPPWPTPPVYTPLWPDSRIRTAFEALVTFRGPGANPVLVEADALGLMERMAADYNAVAAKLTRRVWELEGMASEP